MSKTDAEISRTPFSPPWTAQPPREPVFDDPAMIAALRAQHLQIVFQPQYTLSTMQLRGFEALARLSVDEHHWVPPDRFLPLAQAAGLMGALTLHMVEAACQALRGWRDGGRSPVFIAVNIEPDDLADVLFAPRVCRLLAEYRVAAGELELELVERRALGADATTQTSIAVLRAAGIRFAMDDFGTGQSALSQLGDLPFDIVKIDKTFLHRVPCDPAACTLLPHVIALCLALHKEVVVEGVESDEQLQWLVQQQQRGLRVQGNALSFPLPEALAAASISLLPGFSPKE